MQPGAWRCIVHAALVGQRQGNAALGQAGRLESDELQSQVETGRGRLALLSHAQPRQLSAPLGGEVVPNARAITQTVASIGALPALLGRGEFRDGMVPSGTGPLGVYPVHRAKGIALKAGPG